MIYECEEPWWNAADRENPKNLERNLFKCYFVHLKLHTDAPSLNPGLHIERPTNNRLSHGTTNSRMVELEI
jgi:hypothetical protein